MGSMKSELQSLKSVERYENMKNLQLRLGEVQPCRRIKNTKGTRRENKK